MRKLLTVCAVVAVAVVTFVTPPPVASQGFDQESSLHEEQLTQHGASNVHDRLGPIDRDLPPQQEAPTTPSTYTVPVFIIEAISFTAVDETGIDILGSDEVYASWTTESYTAYSALFGDVDSGNTRYFHEYQRCMYPMSTTRQLEAFEGDAWQCRPEGGSGDVDLRVDMYESDSWYGKGCGRSFDGTAAPECNKDWIGGHSASFTEEELVAMLPTPDESRSVTVRLERRCSDNPSDAQTESAPGANLCGADLLEADYDFEYRITRLDDRILYDHSDILG